MQYLTTRDVYGNININDNSSNEYKLLSQCNNDELLDEERHRSRVLSKEQSRKDKIFFKVFLFMAIMLLIAYTLFEFEGNPFASTIFAMIGLLPFFASLTKYQQNNQFELRQINTLNEIHMLLKERGIR